MTLPWLQPEEIFFPDVNSARKEPPGLLAAGGALTPAWLLTAYGQGIFPWFNKYQPILWWSPDPRMVLFPDRLKVSRSLRKKIKNNPYHFYINRDFSAVIAACAALRANVPGTWITSEMAAAYQTLHEQGYAHSVEVWREDELVGGLYGVALGRIFFGESMFSLESNTSKLALAGLVGKLKQWQFELIDCQMSSQHLRSLGAEEISRQDFCELVAAHGNVEHSMEWPQAERLYFEERTAD